MDNNDLIGAALAWFTAGLLVAVYGLVKLGVLG